MVAPDDPITRRTEPVPARSEPSAAAFVLAGPIDRADIPVLCDRFRAAVQADGGDERDGRPVTCDVAGLSGPGAATVEAVDALARLALTARRLGRRLVLHGTADDLRDLLVLTGLAEVVLPGDDDGTGNGDDDSDDPFVT